MNRILALVGLGILSPLVFFLGAAPFEVPGQNPIMERVGGSLAVAIYCAVCQFWLARRSAKPATSSWARLSAMVVPIVATCLLAEVAEGGQSWRYSWGPLLVAGCVGSVAAVFLGSRTSGVGEPNQRAEGAPGKSPSSKPIPAPLVPER